MDDSAHIRQSCSTSKHLHHTRQEIRVGRLEFYPPRPTPRSATPVESSHNFCIFHPFVWSGVHRYSIPHPFVPTARRITLVVTLVPPKWMMDQFQWRKTEMQLVGGGGIRAPPHEYFMHGKCRWPHVDQSWKCRLFLRPLLLAFGP